MNSMALFARVADLCPPIWQNRESAVTNINDDPWLEIMSDAWLIKEAIINEAGQDVFDQLCATMGGQDIHIPARPETITQDHSLAQALGLETARTLAKATGIAKYYVPFSAAEDHTTADKVVQLLHTENLSNGQIAGRVGVSQRHVRRLLAARGIRNPNRPPAPRRHPSATALPQNSAIARF